MEVIKKYKLFAGLIGVAAAVLIWAVPYAKTADNANADGLEVFGALIWLLIFYTPIAIFGIVTLIRAISKKENTHPPAVLLLALFFFLLIFCYIPR